MNIFFTAPYSGKKDYQKYYDLIISYIKNTGATVSSPELDKNFPLPSQSPHYQKIKEGILASDAAIMEISKECFQLGHEATIATQNKKHVLCLSQFENFGDKINNRYFHGAKYSELNLEEIIIDFINSLHHHQFDQRFNFFLSANQLQTLDQNATKNNQTKSDFLRSLIDNH